MRVVHEPGRADRTLATEVEVARSTLAQARGLMLRESVPEGYALVIEVGADGLLPASVRGLLPFVQRPPRQFVHMLLMRFSIDVLWLVDGEVSKTARLTPWTGLAAGRADRILELPAGSAEGVEPGDRVSVEGLDGD
jgi:uncharacterized membrane protein (UPF0127 family)